MIVNDPETLAEITAMFERYERALMTDDIEELDALFHASPFTVRYGVAEVLYGYDEIAAFRRARGGSPQRALGQVAIATYGKDFAATNAEFFREPGGRRGRQSQGWVRFPEGWRIVSAHVSIEGGGS